ncbi:Vesicle transport protein, Use1 [Corchorus capsularis]|uniref:Vesicle transport protein, Use1 n=1 Tax=Corchorus capsularis TaxID=210143 RepID=A0A1R3J326_COCAP|nr:Vesicle transport protein, Use1 [Corchorus capsularis]
MGMSKTQINLRRLLAAAPQQQNPSKLIHYVATLRELLEKLAEERTPDGLPRVSKAVINDYSEKIENIASELSAKLPTVKVSQEPATTSNSFKQSPQSDVENHAPSSPGLRRRVVPTSSFKDETRDNAEAGTSDPVKLDAAAQMHIEKHRKLQEDLTDEMVGLARQLKESSLMMSQSLENTEKLLDSTEKAVEDSLSRTGHANDRAMKIYSETSKTTCFQWLLIFFMTCIFIMVVLLIRVT